MVAHALISVLRRLRQADLSSRPAIVTLLKKIKQKGKLETWLIRTSLKIYLVSSRP